MNKKNNFNTWGFSIIIFTFVLNEQKLIDSIMLNTINLIVMLAVALYLIVLNAKDM